MAETSSFTPGSYDQYVAGVLQDTGTLLAPAKGKAPAQAAPDAALKAQTGPYDTYIGDTLKDVDALLAPPKAPPKDYSVSPMDGILERVGGVLEGVGDVVAGGLSMPISGIAGFLAPDTASGERNIEKVQDTLRLPASTNADAASSRGTVNKGVQDVLGAPGQALDWLYSKGQQTIPDALRGTPAEQAQREAGPRSVLEAAGQAAPLLLGGKAAEAPKAVPLDEPVEPPPPSSQPHATEPAYTAPDVHKTVPTETPAAASPGATPAAPTKDALDGLPGNHASMALPKAYKGAKPRYGDLQLKFGSDVEKALYIVANPKTKSASHDVYMSWLKNSLGMDEGAVMSLAKASRARTISLAKQGQSDIPAYKASTEGEVTTPRAPKLKVRLKPKPDAAEPAPKTSEGEKTQENSPKNSLDLSRRFSGTQHSTHTPLQEGEVLPSGYVHSKIRFHAGDIKDISVPMRIEFERPQDQSAWKLGERVRDMFGWDKEPRPNTATPEGRQLIQDVRQYIHDHQPEWAQNDDRANMMYLRQLSREVRDLNQRPHNVLRDHLEENFPDNPKGELRANPHKYAFSTKVPAWQPRDLVTKCF